MKVCVRARMYAFSIDSGLQYSDGLFFSLSFDDDDGVIFILYSIVVDRDHLVMKANAIFVYVCIQKLERAHSRSVAVLCNHQPSKSINKL